MQRLPKRVKTVWLFSALGGALFWIAILIGYRIAQIFWSWLPIWGLLIVLIIGLIVTFSEIALIPYRYRFYHFAVNETDVEIQKGFFFRKHISIPIARVQNVDLNQGPFLITQHLYEVKIATGGSNHSIDALTKEHATELKNRVMQLALEAKNAQ
ncbi:PH domain-containing protein [Nicoliella spurrieriana]|uniref:PH domain-containing protein n=1 Tax=Nicoliella spurrieriana TaxID=2925830 RepID=A0A976RSU6_9LACO|nr:PH domain-containing protein [Nicoliella spurrieriana]UQS87217.1 PH domain-containing protein [Nicoliella spurrieriana]